MTSMDGGTGHWRIELEESYPVMGLTSLEVELEPSYEGLEFRSRGRLLTNFLERSPASSDFLELSQTSSNFLEPSENGPQGTRGTLGGPPGTPGNSTKRYIVVNFSKKHKE